MKRPFNSGAYNKYDNSNKELVISIFENRGYTLHAGLKEELYKECDVIMKHNITNKIIRIENESREDFDKIKNFYSTVHIPIRKLNTQANFYFVWRKDQSECMIIDIDECREFKIFNNITSVVCTKDRNLDAYSEEFIDIPKSLVYKCKVDHGNIIYTEPRNEIIVNKYKKISEMGKHFRK